MNKLKTLEKEASKIREQINELKEKEALEKYAPFLITFVGKCYKYRNNYSCPEKASDYWWLYKKIIGYTKDKDGYVHLIIEEFEIDLDGKCDFNVDDLFVYHDGREPLESYKEITNTEYQKAKDKFSQEILSQSKMRKIISNR